MTPARAQAQAHAASAGRWWAGMLLGSLGGAVALAQRVGRFRASLGAILCEGLCLLLVGFTQAPWVMVAGFAVFGFCVATVQMVGQTHRMLAIPPGFRARMTAVNMMVMQVGGVLGPGLAGVALSVGSVHQVYAGFGAALFAVGLGYTLVPGYRAFLNLPHAQVAGHYGREFPSLFK